MSGHEFEKQVRQKLNDLKMTPSAEAWENIENKMRDRKRRPVAFYWVPLLLLGLAAGGYLFFNNDQKTILSANKSTPNTNTQPKKETSPENPSGSSLSVVPKKEPDVLHSNRTSADIPSDKKAYRAEKENNGNRPVLPRLAATGGIIYNSLQQKQVTITHESNDAPITVVSETKNVDEPEGKNPSLKISDFPVGSISSSPLNSLRTLSANNTYATKKTHAEKINRWSYGLSGSAGVSAVNEGHLLNFNNAQVEDVSRVPAFAPQPPYKPSSISPGISFSAGGFVKRDISKKFSLSLGLNYLQLNTRNKVGSQVNGSQIVNNGIGGYLAVVNYFTIDQDKPSDYRNKYHFIEVPLILHTKINKSRKAPIHVNTGIAVSHLLRSNSLHFDGTTGVYYRNDKLLNQTQVAVNTGVSVGILNKTTRPIWIGPSARYNVTNILQKNMSAKKNFMSLGIDVKMFIK